jgi:electron transport complex protein RnfC
MFRGLKIKSYKENTRDEKIENLPFPEEVTIYASQHIGAPSNIIVNKGDIVKRGQIIAECQGACSLNQHASISGKVKEIAKVARPCGVMCDAIVITKDGEQDIALMSPLTEITPELIRERTKEAGICGMGGAGFPSHIKLDPPKKIDIAFLNGCECEPYLTADERVMEEEPEKTVDGFALAIKAVGAEKGIIGIEDDKKTAIENIKRAAWKHNHIEVAVLPKVYPQGYEKMLITQISGREVPSGGLPHDVGVSVHNVGTCVAMYEAVYEGKPLIERVLTVSGEQMINRVNVKSVIGMKIEDILQYYEISKSNASKILMGGPMMGTALDSTDIAVQKTTSGLLLKQPKEYKEYPCVVCGKCVDVCPMNLVPQRLNRLADGQDWAKIQEEGLRDCMECGCCTYTCPSKISLTYKFKTAKTML